MQGWADRRGHPLTCVFLHLLGADEYLGLGGLVRIGLAYDQTHANVDLVRLRDAVPLHEVHHGEVVELGHRDERLAFVEHVKLVLNFVFFAPGPVPATEGCIKEADQKDV